ncbi:lytic murein transglycosylase [Bradyrhizobium commune]|uniref:Lytic murein transglycosylase n=1 Tax=Bradyrhizobium commune TaxID=83627 RepID=A0A7S9D4J8_9BRAD|nr:lytic murein transglycosylase [Bradyrhizobium commune]QPF91070.1 lytic murein transglycosylase [Bradyrhizobium commune]
MLPKRGQNINPASVARIHRGLAAATFLVASLCGHASAADDRSAAGSATIAPDEPSDTARAFKSCMAQIAPEALRRVSRQTFDGATSALEPDPVVLERLQFQPEFELALWQYLDIVVNDGKIAAGRAALERFRAQFDAVEEAFGVDRYVIAAIWGVETNYGTEVGPFSVIRSTATLACSGRRQAYFRDQFLAALEILQRGYVAADRFRGSWSGAFGGGQFMPTTFLNYAVDFDGNGRPDIIDDVSDVLASIANVLHASGWSANAPCAVEVDLPSGFDYALVLERRPIAEWMKSEVRPLADGSIDQRQLANLSVPAGHRGPPFLLLPNFDVIKQYNPAYAYAFAVCQLAGRIRGEAGISKPWPRDERVLSSAERMELQSLLRSNGFDAGPSDGMLGPRTSAAIVAFEKKANLVPDGFASSALLDHLRHP